MLQGVLFDLYDTLICRQGAGQMDRAGVPPEMLEEFRAVWEAWGPYRMTREVPYAELLREVYGAANREPDRSRIAELARQRAAHKRQELLSVNPAVLSMVDDCRERGLAIAVVSGCAVDDVTAWREGPLAERVETAIFSWEVGVNKPDPSIYRAALERLGIDGPEAAFVDDSPACLDGARAVGVQSVFRACWCIDRPHIDEELIAGAVPILSAARSGSSTRWPPTWRLPGGNMSGEWRDEPLSGGDVSSSSQRGW